MQEAAHEPSSRPHPDDRAEHLNLRDRMRASVYAAKLLADRALGDIASKDVRESMSTESITLHRYEERETTSIDPLTGEIMPTTEIDFPRVPQTKHEHTELYGHHTAQSNHPNARHETANSHHPLLQSLADAIAEGDFQGAFRAHRTIQDNMETARDKRIRPSVKIASKLTSTPNTREAFLGSMHKDILHAEYDTVMAVPVDDLGDGRNWQEELNLKNIQTLRTRIMHTWSREQNPQGDTIIAHAAIRAGGVINISLLEVATYLGVEPAKLRKQVRNQGETVVPPQVLTKLSFFLQFCADDMPEGQLTKELKAFNDSEDYDPTVSGSPIFRLNEMEEKIQKGREKVDLELKKADGLRRPTTVDPNLKVRERADYVPKKGTSGNPTSAPQKSVTNEHKSAATLESRQTEDPYRWAVEYVAGYTRRDTTSTDDAHKSYDKVPFERMSEESFIGACGRYGIPISFALRTYREFRDLGLIKDDNSVDTTRISTIARTYNSSKANDA